MKQRMFKAAAAVLSAAVLLQQGARYLPQQAAAEEAQYLFGDVDLNAKINAADLTVMKRILLGLHEPDRIQSAVIDVSADGEANIADAILMTQYLTAQIDSFPSGMLCTVSDEPDQPDEPGNTEEQGSFLSPSISIHGASLPTAGDANLVIFYVDFPDCRYDYAPSEDELNRIAFGEANPANACYPFESFSAFYGRASKGNMNLKGRGFRYTTKENQAVYDDNKVKIAEECYDAFKDSVDFAQFDGDGDGRIDATLFTTPTKSGDDHWWPWAGALGDPN